MSARVWSVHSEMRTWEENFPLLLWSLINLKVDLLIVKLREDLILPEFLIHFPNIHTNMFTGRMFNHQLLDMIELGVDNIRLMSDVKVSFKLQFKNCNVASNNPI